MAWFHLLDSLNGDEPAKPSTVDKYSTVISKSMLESTEGQMGGTSTLHISGLHRLCPREFVLNYWKPTKNPSIGLSNRLQMSTGTHLHSYMQEKVLGPLGVLYGKWRDRTTGHTVEGFHPDCVKALSHLDDRHYVSWHFVENKVFHPTYRFSGYYDGDVCLERLDSMVETSRVDYVELEGKGSFELLEIKSTGEEQFEKLLNGNPISDSYKMQATVYANLTGKSKVLFLYIARDTMRIHTRWYYPEECWWNEAIRKSSIIWRAIKNRTLPDSMMPCSNKSDWRAKSCPHVATCFDKKLNFEKWVEEQIALQPERKWIDPTEFGW